VKAAVYYENGGPEVLRYEDVPDPVCGADGVLVQVEAISIEGGDTLNRAGGPLFGSPHIVGYQCAGTVVQVGEQVAVPAILTWPIPEEADLVACACVPVAFGTAHDCLFEFGHLRDGEVVLVQAAAGGVGVAAVQLAKRAGATVIGTASSEARLAPLRALGLDHAVDYTADDWTTKVRALSGGEGVDLAVDSVGGRILQGSVQCLRYRGRAITVGSAGRDPQPFDSSVLSLGNQSLTGVFLGAEMAHERARRMIGELVDEVAAGALTVLVDRTFPLAEAAAAHAFIESRQAVGRVVLVP
jgi:NADPH2:quinone reductase